VGERRLILVDGPAGAGKTTFATGLAAGLEAPVIHLDDLYLGWSGLETGFSRLVELVLEPWLAGQPAAFEAFDWAAGAPTGPLIEVPAGRTLVVEGCASAPRAAKRFEPLIVWMDGPRPKRHRAVLDRDGADEAPLLRAWEQATEAHFQRESTSRRAAIRLIRR
jgi:hypothetical protein